MLIASLCLMCASCHRGLLLLQTGLGDWAYSAIINFVWRKGFAELRVERLTIRLVDGSTPRGDEADEIARGGTPYAWAGVSGADVPVAFEVSGTALPSRRAVIQAMAYEVLGPKVVPKTSIGFLV
jgi:hypothetical protein